MIIEQQQHTNPHATNINDLLINVPDEFLKTTQHCSILNKLGSVKVAQLYGHPGCGKSCLLLGLMKAYCQKLRFTKTASLLWVFPQLNDESEFLEQMLCLIQTVHRHGFISHGQLVFMTALKPERSLEFLLRIMGYANVFCVYAFTSVTALLKGPIRKTCQKLIHSSSQQLILVTNKKDEIFTEFEIDSQVILIHEVLGFTVDEATQYLSNNLQKRLCTAGGEMSELAEDQSMFKRSARDVAKYFGCNPLCLKAVYTYCNKHLMLLNQFLLVMQQTKGLEFSESVINVFDDETEQRTSLRNMHSYFEDQEGLNEQFSQALLVLAMLNNENIPFYIVEEVCFRCGIDDKETIPTTVRSLIAKKFIYQVKKILPIISTDGFTHLCIPRYFSDLLQSRVISKQENYLEILKIGIGSLASCYAYDVRDRTDNEKLSELSNQIAGFVPQVFTCTGDSVDAELLLYACKLHQLHVASSNEVLNWDVRAKKIQTGIQFVWSAVCRLLNTNEDDLAIDFGFNESGNNEQQDSVVELIASACIAAGEKLEFSMFEMFYRMQLKLRKMNLTDFALFYSKKRNSDQEETKTIFKPFRKAMKHNWACTKSQIQFLVEAKCMLDLRTIKKVFFAECLSSLLHSYGRLDLYFWRNMDRKALNLCLYYTNLSNKLAKYIRTKHGISLLSEYITNINSLVPRALQSRSSDVTSSLRMKQLLDCYILCRKIQHNEHPYFENGLLVNVQQSTFSRLNVWKYLLKAVTKMLKHVSAEEIPRNSLYICDQVIGISKSAKELDISFTCLMMAAKFYAAMMSYDKAFTLFDETLTSKRTTSDFHCTPNTYAWAASNFARGVVCAKDRKTACKNAVRSCRHVLENEKNLCSSWKNTLSEYLHALNNLMVSASVLI